MLENGGVILRSKGQRSRSLGTKMLKIVPSLSESANGAQMFLFLAIVLMHYTCKQTDRQTGMSVLGKHMVI